jgi:hypothetical protein
MNALGSALQAGLNIVTFPTPKAPRFHVRRLLHSNAMSITNTSNFSSVTGGCLAILSASCVYSFSADFYTTERSEATRSSTAQRSSPRPFLIPVRLRRFSRRKSENTVTLYSQEANDRGYFMVCAWGHNSRRFVMDSTGEGNKTKVTM